MASCWDNPSPQQTDAYEEGPFFSERRTRTLTDDVTAAKVSLSIHEAAEPTSEVKLST